MEGLESQLDPQFGRAYAFIIVEPEFENIGSIAAQFFNSAAAAAHGAGTAATVIMKSNGVEAVISGRFGPKAYQALQACDIEMWIAPSGISAREAIDLFMAGNLEQMKMTVY